MFENELKNILIRCELRHRDKNVLLKHYISERLNSSLNTYYKELEQSVAYLNNRKAENVVKKL